MRVLDVPLRQTILREIADLVLRAKSPAITPDLLRPKTDQELLYWRDRLRDLIGRDQCKMQNAKCKSDN